jgi:phosphoribosylaminoimidazole carboxylase
VLTLQRNSICHVVVAPAPVSGDILARAQAIAAAAVAGLDGAGVFGVELFQLEDGTVWLNEIAPRVHNSGHFTTEACSCSQFEQHLRAVLDLPLGDAALAVPAAAMINVLGTGDGAEDVEATWALCARALTTKGARVHWYGKEGVRAGRKVGHINLTGESPMAVAAAVRGLLAPAAGATASDDAGLPPPAPLVGIIMGSDSDLPTLTPAASTLRDFGVPFELTIVSAHRTPQRMYEYARSARARGLKVIIAAAGGAAHLPGMVAALTPLPVIGVPVPLKHLDGVDSLHSIVQMPRGVPVATVAIGNSVNAALLAVRMLGASMPALADAMAAFQDAQEAEVLRKVELLALKGWEAYKPGVH